jgi:hypothetical protein
LKLRELPGSARFRRQGASIFAIGDLQKRRLGWIVRVNSKFPKTMKTNENCKTATVSLRDGKAELAFWSQDFENSPTVGERIEVTSRCAFPGYGDHASVASVHWDPESGGQRIDLQADCEIPDHARPEVFLNASMFPAERRAVAEECVRLELGVPLLHWEESFEPRAIVRLREGKGTPKVPLVALQSKLTAIARRQPQLAAH